MSAKITGKLRGREGGRIQSRTRLLAHRSTPILCAVMYVQDFNGFGLHYVHDNIGKRRKRQLPVPLRWPGLPLWGAVLRERIR